MKPSTLAPLFIILMLIPSISATCLTQIEQDNIRAVALNTSVNPDVFLNIFEQLCNQQYTIDAINSFNSTISSQMNTLSNNTASQINAINNQMQTALNNSDLIQTLNQIAQLYGQSIALNNDSVFTSAQISQSEARMNAKMDNQTLDLLNRFQTLESSINQQLVEKQSNALSTNRIILIVIGLVLLAGGFWYFSRKKVNTNPRINPLPPDMDSDYPLNNEKSINSNSNKGKSRR
jgi:LPXTG-motif cell wall-anchored protein